MKTSREHEQRMERIRGQIKDRQDYRNTLIERRESVDKKIEALEKQISELRGKLLKKAA